MSVQTICECGCSIDLTDEQVTSANRDRGYAACLQCGSIVEIVAIEGVVMAAAAGRWSDEPRPLEAMLTTLRAKR